MAVKPRIADVRCTRLDFRPGDRIMVRTTHRLDKEEKAKLKKSIERWAGAPVEVLIFCPLDFDVEVEHRDGII